MAENNTACASGIIIFLLSGASLFIWIYLHSLYLVLYIIGTALFCISGILFLVGGVKNNHNTVRTAFGLGVPAWSLIIVSCIGGLIWNPSQLASINFTYILLGLFFMQSAPEYGFYYLLMILSDIAYLSRRYNIGVFGSIVHIPIAVIALIFGIIELASVLREKW